MNPIDTFFVNGWFTVSYDYLYELIPTANILSPTLSEATSHFYSLVRDINKLSEASFYDKTSHFLPLSNYDLNSIKYKHCLFLPHFSYFSRIFGPRIGLTFTLLYNTYNKLDFNFLFRVLCDLGFNNFKDESRLLEAFKLLTIFAKNEGYHFWPSKYKLFIDLDRSVGYLEGEVDAIEKHEEQLKNIKQWVTNNASHTIDNNHDLFLIKFKESISQLLLPDLTNIDKIKTLDDWFSDPSNWGSAGSSYSSESELSKEAKLFINVDGVNRKVHGTKTVAGLVLPKETILNNIISRELTQVAKVLIKHEPTKLRPVAVTGLEATFAQNYILGICQILFDSNTHLAIMQNNLDKYARYCSIVQDVKDRKYMCPFDWASFDHQITNDMIIKVLEVLENVINTMYISDKIKTDFALACSKVKDQLTNVKVFLSFSSKIKTDIVRVEGGLLSGWQLTSFLGSVINFGCLNIFNLLITEKGLLDSAFYNDIFSGDDSSLTFNNLNAAVCFVDFCRYMNIDVNLRKNYISTDHTEFLRYIFTSDSILGVPVRAVCAVLWRKPTSQPMLDELMKGRDIVSNWMLLRSRLRNDVSEKFFELMVSDLVYGLKLTREEILAYLATPAAFGGLGCDATFKSDIWFRLEPGVMRSKFEVISPLSGLKDIKIKFSSTYSKFDSLKFDKDIVASVLDPKMFGRLVKPRKVSIIKPFSDLRLSRFVLLNAQAIKRLPKPRFIKGLPVTGRSLLIDQMIRNKDYDNIHSVIDQEQRDLSIKIEKNGGRHVWLDWIKGKLPYSPPPDSGFNMSIVSEIYDDILSKVYYSELVSGKGTNLFKLKCLAMYSSKVTFDIVQKLPVFYSD